MAHRSDVFQRDAVECGLCFVGPHACRMYTVVGLGKRNERRELHATAVSSWVRRKGERERRSNWAQVIVINMVVISVLSHTISIDTGNQFVTLLRLLYCPRPPFLGLKFPFANRLERMGRNYIIIY